LNYSPQFAHAGVLSEEGINRGQSLRLIEPKADHTGFYLVSVVLFLIAARRLTREWHH
jgi:hypothetical protein